MDKDEVKEAFQELESSLSDALYAANRLLEQGFPAANTILQILASVRRTVEQFVPEEREYADYLEGY